MVAVLLIVIGAAAVTAGAVLGWTPLARGLIVSGAFLVVAGWDLLPDDEPDT